MQKKIRYIDSLRGIACIIVLVAHIVASDSVIGRYASGCGKIGVWLFMLLSGMLLIMPYLNSDKNFGLKEWGYFYKKKIIRLFPAYIIALLAAIALGFVEFKDLWRELLLNQAWGHFWYMPVIIKFYLVAPIFLWLFCLIKKLNCHSEIIFGWMMVLIGGAFAVGFPFPDYVENSISLYWYMPVFCLGMVLAVVNKKVLDKDSPYLDCLLGVPVIGIIIVTPLFRRLLWGIEPSGYLQNKYIYMSLMWFFIFLICAKGRYVKKLLENTVLLQRIGDISYEVYLFHFLILNYIVQHFNVNTVVRAIFTITISVLVALILENIRKIVQNKMNDKFIMVIVILCFVLLTFLSLAKDRNTPSEISHAENMEAEETEVLESWENRLYVPTMINKIGEDYFIVDCWNHRVIYSDSLDKNIEEWKTLTSDNYVGGHTVCSDGEIIVLDNTDNSQIIVYEKRSGGDYTCKQVISNVEGRPHYVIYDEMYKYFYIIGSTVGKIYVYKNENGILKWVRTDDLLEIKDSYVRSISLIEGKLYTVSGPGCICKYEVLKDGFRFEESYPVPDELSGMNQICKIEDEYYITVNTGKTGSVDGTTIVRTNDLSKVITGEYEILYDMMGFVGQPYFITYFDDKYYITEISAEYGNGIKSFTVHDGIIEDVEILFYWGDVDEVSRKRYNDVESLCNSDERVDLVLFAGKSNMAGKGNSKDAPIVSKGYEFRAISDPTCLHEISEPFGLYENKENGINDTWEDMTVLRKDGKGGLVSAFANSYYSYSGKGIVGVSSSEGATVIDDWIPGTSRYEDLVERGRLAKNFLEEQEGYKLEHTYLVWCQGESDGDVGTTTEEYKTKLSELFSALIDNGVVEHCFVVVIGQSGKEDGLYDDIRKAQLELCNENDNCSLACDEFYNLKEHMIDEYHFDQFAYNVVGEEAGRVCALFNMQNEE